MEEELARNAALRATLSKLAMPKDEEAVVESEAQKKAKVAMRVIDLQETVIGLKQAVEHEELQVKQLQQTIKEKQTKLKTVQGDIDKERNAGKAVWETVGISTVSYRDPFHTGLSKRTPTGGYFTS